MESLLLRAVPSCSQSASKVQVVEAAASVERGGVPLGARRSIAGAQLHGGLRSRETWARNPKLVVNAQAQNDGRRNGEQRGSYATGDNWQSNKTFESSSVPEDSTSHFIGSPLLWVGVGVGISVIFSMAAGSVKKFAMQQMMKSMMGQMGQTNQASPFGNMPMPPGPGFPFPAPSPSPSPVSQAAAAPPVDVAPSSVSSVSPTQSFHQTEMPATPQPRKSAFTDVSASTIAEQQNMGTFVGTNKQSPPNPEPSTSFFNQEVLGSQSRSSSGAGSSFNDAVGHAAAGGGTVFTVDTLEKMMEDPTVQKMVYPYLPEEMRNPSTFKWMMQNPQYRQQLQDMLNGMGGDGPWDNRMSDMLKNFDLNSTEVKQQFEQIGLTPEEVVGKIMANPEVAVAFQNPRVQAAIMDCSQNPLNITKYQNDKEVMDVFNKISELFPGMAGAGTPF